MGKVVVPAEGDEPRQVIDGIHKGIVSEKLFYKVQEILETNLIKRNKPKAKTRMEILSLRGVVLCSNCQSKMTGSGSRGKLGKKYFYYHCNECSKERYRAEKANKLMELMQERNVGYLAVSLGFYKTLFSAPGTSTSSEIPEDEQAQMGLTEGLIRFSIGLDDDIERTYQIMRQCMKEVGVL